MKMTELLLHATTWMGLTVIILRVEVRHKIIHGVGFHSYKVFKNRQN